MIHSPPVSTFGDGFHPYISPLICGNVAHSFGKVSGSDKLVCRIAETAPESWGYFPQILCKTSGETVVETASRGKENMTLNLTAIFGAETADVSIAIIVDWL